MQEIKFRAWDADIQKFIPVDKIDLKRGLIIAGVSRRWLSEIELEQCTGLHDKNGVEIFEGDIVVWSVNKVSPVGIVEYVSESGGYDLKNFNDKWHVCCDWLRGEYEVVGNIHENPEFMISGKLAILDEMEAKL